MVDTDIWTPGLRVRDTYLPTEHETDNIMGDLFPKQTIWKCQEKIKRKGEK